MYELMIYSLKVGACLAVFYLFFKLLLSRETFHRLNRLLILGAMLLSFVLPLCVITVEQELPAMPVSEEVVPLLPSELIAEQPEPFPWERVAGWLFIAGAIATLAWTLRSLICVLRVVRQGRSERLVDGVVLVRLEQPVTPFSWGRYIVLSQEDYAQSGAEIITHERAHLGLYHSFDLLVTDLAGCLQWFNPAMWLLRRELRAIHEYEADKAVLDSGVDARHYQMMLIKKAAGRRWYSVANSFNHSKLKNRITMMLRKKSSRWACVKTLIVLPLTALALGAFARTAYVFPEDKGKKENVVIHVKGQDISMQGETGRPLYVVDGKPAESVEGLASTVKTMTVLKDSDSLRAIYGDRSKDGVVLIELRKPGEEVRLDPNLNLKTEDKAVVVYGSDNPSKTVTMTRADSAVGLLPKNYRIEMQKFSSDDSKRKMGKMLYIIDGKIVPSSELNNLKTDQIATITVVKEAGKYDGYDGAILVSTEKGNQLNLKAAGLKSANEGLEFARLALEKDRGKLPEAEFKKAQEHLFKAQQTINNADVEMETRLAIVNQITQKSGTDSLSNRSMETVVRVNGSSKTRDDLPNDVLYVLDGKVVAKEDILGINAKKIKSMIVLKDQTAIEKYGEDARNGVIEIVSRK